jgi:hypothetical protein
MATGPELEALLTQNAVQVKAVCYTVETVIAVQAKTTETFLVKRAEVKVAAYAANTATAKKDEALAMTRRAEMHIEAIKLGHPLPF